MALVVKHPRADDDLVEIWEYIADDSVANADAFIDHVDERLRMLATQPLMGRARDELTPGLRSFPVRRYVVFYSVIPDGIAVVRVLHSARDIGTEFEHT